MRADGVMPEILLVAGALGGSVGPSVREHDIVGMPAADARRLHAARGSEIGRPQAHPVHARRRGGNGLDVLHALGRLQDGVDQDRLLDGVLGLELRQQLIQIVDVPRALDLGQHDDVELVAGFAHDLDDVVEHPRAVEAVDARPQAGLAEVRLACHLDEAAARRFLVGGGDGVLEIAEHDVDLPCDILDLRADLLVVRRHEMDHALEPHWQRAKWLRRPDREGREVLRRRAYCAHRRLDLGMQGMRRILRCTLVSDRRESTRVSGRWRHAMSGGARCGCPRSVRQRGLVLLLSALCVFHLDVKCPLEDGAHIAVEPLLEQRTQKRGRSLIDKALCYRREVIWPRFPLRLRRAASLGGARLGSRRTELRRNDRSVAEAICRYPRSRHIACRNT